MKVSSNLEKILTSGHFAATGELGPPKSAEAEVIHPPNDPVAHVCQMFSDHPGGCNVAFGDGAVRFISESINLDVWAAMSSIAGGEAVAGDGQ